MGRPLVRHPFVYIPREPFPTKVGAYTCLFYPVDVFPQTRFTWCAIYTPGAKERVVELPGRSDVWNDNHGTRTLWQTARFRAETVGRDACYSTSER